MIAEYILVIFVIEDSDRIYHNISFITLSHILSILQHYIHHLYTIIVMIMPYIFMSVFARVTFAFSKQSDCFI